MDMQPQTITEIQKLQEADNHDSPLLELQRADWARLWMQVMRKLRQGVRLKKMDYVDHTPIEYQLTPFEMLLEDIRARRYTLHNTRVQRDIPATVKKDAHAVILDFIRSRPPLRRVNDRQLKELPPKSPDAHERLLRDIRAGPKLQPVVRTLTPAQPSCVEPNISHTPPPARKLIRPDFALLLSDSFEVSDTDSELDSPLKSGQHASRSPHSPHSAGSPLAPISPLSPLASPVKHDMNATWHTGHDVRNFRLQRRHTIMVCESPDARLAALQELPPVKEEEEPSPTEDQTPRFQYGSDSPLSGLPDHTLHNGPGLARGGGRGQGYFRPEHRRSLTTGLTAIPEDDTTDGAGSYDRRQFRRQNRRHSLPTVPQRRDQLSVGAKDPGSKDAEFYAGDCHSHFTLDKEQGGHWCRLRGVRPPPPPVSRKDGEAQDLPLLTATENMHVSWKGACQRGDTDGESTCQHCSSVPKRWQNPIECLSLTLEEVTHIRSVLTKAELESLVSHPDLYNQVSKNKVCFTCKTTRFSLFGEWGSRCKFCKRTVCSKCMRKMYMPSEQLKDVPVYTLSSTPFSQETLALVHNYVHDYFSSHDRNNAARRSSTPNASPKSSSHPSAPDPPKSKYSLQRSHSLSLPFSSGPGPGRGPVTSLCCDCKGMVMEIVRASKSSLAVLLPAMQSASPSSLVSQSLSHSSSPQITTTNTTTTVTNSETSSSSSNS